MNNKNILFTLLTSAFAMSLLTGCNDNSQQPTPAPDDEKGFTFETDISKAGFYQFRDAKATDEEFVSKLDIGDEFLGNLVKIDMIQSSCEIETAFPREELFFIAEGAVALYNDGYVVEQNYKEGMACVAATIEYSVTGKTEVVNGEDVAYERELYNLNGEEYIDWYLTTKKDDYRAEMYSDTMSFITEPVVYKEVDEGYLIIGYQTELNHVSTYADGGEEFVYYKMEVIQNVALLNKDFIPQKCYLYSEYYVDHNLDTGLAYSDFALIEKTLSLAEYTYGTPTDFPNKAEFIAAIPDGYIADAEGYDSIGELNNDGGVESFSYLYNVSHYKYEIDNARGTGKLYINLTLEAGEKDLLATFECKKQYKYLKGERAGSKERFNSYYTADMAALYGLQTKTLGTGDDATTYMVVPAGTKVEIDAVVSFNAFEASSNIISVEKVA